MKVVVGLLVSMCIGFSSMAQAVDHEVDWDLSYERVLQLNQIKWDHSQGTLYTWLKHRQEEHQFVTEFVQDQLKNEPEQVFLIDHPTFPSAGRTTIMGVKNGNECYYLLEVNRPKNA